MFDLFDGDLDFKTAPMPTDPKVTIEYATQELLWRPLGEFAQFVFVRHPLKGLSIVMSTDRTLDPLSAVFGYKLRFKIEVQFKQAVHQVGVFMYRFWLRVMLPTKRGSGDQQLQFAPKEFKEKVADKITAYHLFIQLGFIAQGIMQYLSIHHHQIVWQSFGTWLRTVRENTLPSEMVVSLTMKRNYYQFLIDITHHTIFKKFIHKRVGIGQPCGIHLEEKQAA